MAADADNNHNDNAKRNQPSNQGGGGTGGKAAAPAPKRRRLLGNVPVPAPAARVIQEYNEYACISDHEEEEREYLPKAKATRRRGEGNVVGVHKLQQQQQIQQIQRQEQGQESAAKVEEAKNEASALSIFAGRKRNARCYCFNCW